MSQDSQAPLLKYLDELVSHLRERVPTALAGYDVDAIHQARVATRRLKAATDLLAPLLDTGHAKPLNRTLRKLRRRLGPLRDADVMLGHLVDFKRGDAVQWIEQRVHETRVAALETSLSKAPPTKLLGKLDGWERLRDDDVQPRVASIAGLLRESLSKQLDDFASESDKLVNRSTAADAPDPHKVRIAGKSLRYTLEMARAAALSVPADVLRTFKRMQDALGTWHDYIVLTERIQSFASAQQLAHHDAKLQRQLLKLVGRTLQKSDAALAKYGKLWSQQGGAIRDAIAAIAEHATDPPAVAPAPAPKRKARVTTPQTDRDPADSTPSASPAEAPPASTEVA